MGTSSLIEDDTEHTEIVAYTILCFVITFDKIPCFQKLFKSRKSHFGAI